MRRVLLLFFAAVGCEEQQAPLTRGLTAEEHEAYYPIGADAPHALGKASPDGQPLSCTSCHNGGETFATAFCFRCHQLDATPLTTVHGEVAGFQAVDASCLGCHPDGLRGNAQDVPDGPSHSEKNFAIDAGDAHGPGPDGGPDSAYVARLDRTPADDTQCTACHADLVDRTLQLCLDCHLLDDVDIDEAHGPASPRGVAELLRTSYDLAVSPVRAAETRASDNRGCKECHAETPISPVVSPDVTLHNDDTVGIETNHHQATCKQCHRNKLAAPKAWAIDFQTSSCTCCHSAAACTATSQDACPGSGNLTCPTPAP